MLIVLRLARRLQVQPRPASIVHLSSRQTCCSTPPEQWCAARFSSRAAEGPPISAPGHIPQVPYGFRELGIRDTVSQAIEAAFPDVRRPTIAQANFIPAILERKDVLLHDETGTGKSFGSIIALLNKARAKAYDHAKAQRPCITSLVIVPHRDLGYQMLHWIHSILEKSGPSIPDLDSVVQLVVRGDTTIDDWIHKLGTTPPHILIGTPQALWEIYREKKSVLQIESLDSLLVDEADYLLDIPPPYVRKSREGAAYKNFKTHPSPARQLLEAIIPIRKPGAVPLDEIDYNKDDDDHTKKGHVNTKNAKSPTRTLQVIMSSATVHSNLTNSICDAGWMDKDCVILSGKQLLRDNAHMIPNDQVRRSRVVHHAFVVGTDGNLSNVEFAVRPGENSDMKEEKNEDRRSSNYQEKLGRGKIVPSQPPISSVVIEAVASFFALDVPNLALLVLPPGTSVQRAIGELQDVGVNARALDLRNREIDQFGSSGSQAETEPTLLVATPSTTRGVDLPRLTHVFCIGAPNTESADVFKHVAGRVDRFGRGGKVITFVTEREQEYREGVLRTTKNPAGLLKTFYRKLGIKPVWFDLSTVDLSVYGP